jgi:hypothetical protein
MNVFRSLLAAALLAGGAAAAHAQTTVRMDDVGAGLVGAYSTGNYVVSPYGATLATVGSSQAISVFCVDFLNTVSVGQQWAVNVSGLTDDAAILANTRHGDEANAVARYKGTVWLASQMSTASTANKVAIQSAMWELMNAGGPTVAGETEWMNQTYAAYLSNWYGMDFSGWSVLTQVGAAHVDQGVAGQLNATAGRQEFVTYRTPVTATVPEPGTYALVATGLVGVFGAARFRRKQN